MSHAVTVRRGLTTFLAAFVSIAPGACGGVAETGGHGQPATGQENTGGSADSGAPSAVGGIGSWAVAAGGARFLGDGGRGGTGGYGEPTISYGGAVPTGGTGGYYYGSGATGGTVGVDSGPACQNVLSSMSWFDRCPATASCVDLDPNTWRSARDGAVPADGGADFGGPVEEAPFCGPPDPKRRYFFAFEESASRYDGFNVVTGDGACSGLSLGFLGIGGVNDAPLTPVRTHCFSVPGNLLKGRLAVVSLESASITNLRAVSSCDCAYALPYNVNSCPGVEGGGGHPNCG